MAEEATPLESLRSAAADDPDRYGGELALRLTDLAVQRLNEGRWEEWVTLLDEAANSSRRAGLHASPDEDRQVKTTSSHRLEWRQYRQTLGSWRNSNTLDSWKKTSNTLSQDPLNILRRAAIGHPRGPAVGSIVRAQVGARLLADYRLSGDEDELDQALECFREALTGDGPQTTAVLLGLAYTLSARYQVSHDLAVLEEAIAVLRRLLLEEPGHSGALVELANALSERFSVSLDPADVQESVAMLGAAAAHPDGDTTAAPAVLTDLGGVLRSRYERYGDADDLDRAVALFREAARAAGPWEAVSRSNLGSVLLLRFHRTADPNDLKEALAHLRIALRSTRSGAQERRTILSALAECLLAGDHLAQARELFAEALRDGEDALGPAHPEVLACRHNLATVMARLGHCGTAHEEFREVVRLRTAVLGKQHPDTLTSRHNLAAALADLGRSAEAEREFAEVAKDRAEVLGPDHPDTRSSLASLHRIGPS